MGCVSHAWEVDRLHLIGSCAKSRTYISLLNLPHEPNTSVIRFFITPVGNENPAMLYYTVWNVHALTLTCFLANTWFS